MSKNRLPIHIYRGSKLLDDQTVMIGEALLKRWKIPANATITLKIGSMRKDVRLVSVSGLASMRVSEPLAAKLGLLHGLQLCVQYKPSVRTLHIGPLIGVLVRRVYASRTDAPFGAMRAFCREMTEACRAHGGQVVFFTPDDIPSSLQSLTAWTFDGRWVKRTVPIPDVVYNRLTTRKSENNPTVQHFMREIKQRLGASVFNEKYLNKTEVFEALRHDPSLHGYLPESHLFKNYAMLKTMVDKYGIVFLKPITGSLGKGIIRVARLSSGVVVHATYLGGVRSKTFPNLTQAFQSMTGRLRQQKYQIQQGLRLMESGGKPVDFRSLVQKGAKGEWSVTSIVARIAPGGSIVSNVAQGGTLSKVSEAVARSNLPAGSRSAMMARLRKASIDIAKGIEQRIPAHFGELGIDLAADQNGKVWLLEVNSKPSKDDNTPLIEGKIRPSVRELIGYAQHLAKFRKG